MKKRPALEINDAGFLTLLSVSPFEADHSSLHAIAVSTRWVLFKAHDVVSALALVERHNIGVVVCERDCTPGTWTGMLDRLKRLSPVPTFIVTSRLADERLWIDALESGAWDVLAKPFDRNEVLRSLISGWHHWCDQVRTDATRIKALTAAS